jgi:methionyl-tRNA formyltransferase
MQKPFDIPDEADVEYVYDGLMHLGADICLETLEKIIAADGHPESIPQEELEAKFSRLYDAPKLFKNTCEINWDRPCKRIYDFVRGLSPYPGAWTTLRQPSGKETVLKIFKTTKTTTPATGRVGQVVALKKQLCISCADYLLQIDELQLAGKKRMDAASFLNGWNAQEDWLAE